MNFVANYVKSVSIFIKDYVDWGNSLLSITDIKI